ncbi:dihydrofolate reductase family protein [Tropicibacter naphthalenivorans]|uniref:Bacterial bifunctional deaminase-reductase C-terminal domain-containing protein n=1 Tax=Tropicibacter naphthalenivorans TaxID=441103 RepID=A0A0P1GKC8_9RHOB|nr:dihydrofolate reductase family protein [Tropicibacter naphthalenivorans]CUH82094.1 hypothetical protein TRN7648_03811 [Tropicibacter naphthalenivorans]SMD08522.1 Dihydrofolate reductase [Tropicibacter naphthalenivorans]
MINGHVFIATSLDGFIARADHEIDWLEKQPVEGEDHGYDAFIGRVDGIVMGSNTFRRALDFEEWPYTLPVVVLSQSLTLDDIPADLQDKVRLTRARPFRLMQALEKEGWKNVYVDGGSVVQSFLRADLIREITITTVPILLGHGRRLFGALDRDMDLELEDVNAYPSGLVTCRYVIPAQQQD